MQLDEKTAMVSKKMLRAGWIICALPASLLLFSGGTKLAKPPFAVESSEKLGWGEHLIIGLGIVEITCTIIYLIPRTAVLGAVLLTGYLGGAVATHVRVGEPFPIPVILGVLVWAGLWLRDERVRQLLPLRSY